jgi:flagellar basal-body rod protein FlgG
VRFTRDGRFHRDAGGNLVTTQGFLVLDADSQPIRLAQEGEIVIAENGALSIDGQAVGQLGIFQVPPESLQRAGDTLFASTAGPTPATDVRVRQGYLESSNVDASSTLVEMLLVARTYEASQRMVQIQDQVLARTMDIGRVT